MLHIKYQFLKGITHTCVGLFVVLGFFAVMHASAQQWTGPTGAPTTDQPPSPLLHTGTAPQEKAGALTIMKDVTIDGALMHTTGETAQLLPWNGDSNEIRLGMVQGGAGVSTMPTAIYSYQNGYPLHLQSKDGSFLWRDVQGANVLSLNAKTLTLFGDIVQKGRDVTRVYPQGSDMLEVQLGKMQGSAGVSTLPTAIYSYQQGYTLNLESGGGNYRWSNGARQEQLALINSVAQPNTFELRVDRICLRDPARPATDPYVCQGDWVGSSVPPPTERDTLTSVTSRGGMSTVGAPIRIGGNGNLTIDSTMTLVNDQAGEYYLLTAKQANGNQHYVVDARRYGHGNGIDADMVDGMHADDFGTQVKVAPTCTVVPTQGYYTSAAAQCPTNTVVMGGGCEMRSFGNADFPTCLSRSSYDPNRCLLRWDQMVPDVSSNNFSCGGKAVYASGGQPAYVHPVAYAVCCSPVAAPPVPPPPPLPTTPTNVSASATCSSSAQLSIAVRWNPVTGADGYKIYENGTLKQNVSGGAQSSYTIASGLNQGVSYRYEVSAYNAGGESPRSTAVSATTLACLACPNNCAAYCNGSQYVGQGTCNTSTGACTYPAQQLVIGQCNTKACPNNCAESCQKDSSGNNTGWLQSAGTCNYSTGVCAGQTSSWNTTKCPPPLTCTVGCLPNSTTYQTGRIITLSTGSQLCEQQNSSRNCSYRRVFPWTLKHNQTSTVSCSSSEIIDSGSECNVTECPWVRYGIAIGASNGFWQGRVQGDECWNDRGQLLNASAMKFLHATTNTSSTAITCQSVPDTAITYAGIDGNSYGDTTVRGETILWCRGTR